MRLAEAIRQPALLQSEAMLLPALPRENVRAALSQVRSKDKNIKIDDASFKPAEPAVTTAVRTGRPSPTITTSGSIAGRAILRQVGAPYGGAVPTVRQNVRFHDAPVFHNMAPRGEAEVTTATAVSAGAVQG